MYNLGPPQFTVTAWAYHIRATGLSIATGPYGLIGDTDFIG